MVVRKSAEIRKAEIVCATLKLADELGPDRLTTQAVAKAVGLTQPGIFRHFPTKQDLWLAVAMHITAKMTAAWENVLAAELEPRFRIKSLILVQLNQISENPAIPMILHSRELRSENVQMRAQFKFLMTRFQTMLEEAFAEGRARGDFRDDLAPQDSAVLMISMVQGLAVRWSLGQRAYSLETEGARLLACQIGLFQVPSQWERNL
jgi:AcrR family transcriptional regulator